MTLGRIARIPGWITALALLATTAAWGQAWRPDRVTEFITSSAAGGSNDQVARAMQKILQDAKLITTPIAVANKSGGNQTLAVVYLTQHPGDAHYLLVGTSPLIGNHITGQGSLYYGDFTPIASLFNDYTVFALNAGSPIAAGKDLIARLKDPTSMATGFATTFGSHNHIAACLLVKAVGGNARELKAVAFKGSAEAITALLGGHLDLVTTAAGNAAPHVASGRMRVVAAAAPARLGGALASVPTWKEQGVELVFGGWRAIMAPKGLTPAQVAYWEGVLRKATQVPEWRTDLEKNYWSDDFVESQQFRKDLEKDYADMKSVLVDLGLAKQ